MASWKEEEDDFGSLFEGMILIDPSSQTTAQREDDSPPPPPTTTTASSQQQQQQPLDENLFSDLTLVQTLSPQSESDPHPQTTTTTTTPTMDVPSLPTRQLSSRRKKRGGIRIGYAREAADPDTNSHPSLPYSPSPDAIKIDGSSDPPSLADSDSNSNLHADLPLSHAQLESPPPPDTDLHLSPAVDIGIPENKSTGKSGEEDTDQCDTVREQVTYETEELPTMASQYEKGEDPSTSIEEQLEAIRAQISKNLERIREKASSVSTARKESVRRKRKATDNVNSASLRYKDLEKELEEACETEDFERAEKVSERLAVVEKEKEAFLNTLREAEAECDSVESKMQEVLELQITTEEEGASMLERFAMTAADSADLILRNAEEFSFKEMEEWLSSTEALEIEKMALDIESQLINEARSGLKGFIETSIEDDRKEKELLSNKRDVLMDELDKLLVLVRLKETEIAENCYKIEEVEKRITTAVSGFHNAQSSIEMKYDALQGAFSQIESESEALSMKKKEADRFMSEMEEKRSKLRELASVCVNEAKACQELVELRKTLAASILKSRKDRVNLAKTEEKISEDVQMLREQVSASRASLQELSSTRASIQQEIASSKQRIGFIDKRSPELEVEKKVAAAARNFKEAGRIAAEAKALTVEKEDLRDRMEKAIFEFEKVEEEIKDTVNKLQESERLISSKEKEAAMAGCERLRLVAAAAMAERTAALKLSDLEEADILLAEAEAADFEAKKLQQAYEFEMEEIKKEANVFISVALIANLAGKELAEMAATVQPNSL